MTNKELKAWLTVAIDTALIGEGELDYWFRTKSHVCFQPPGLKLTYRIAVEGDNSNLPERLLGFKKRIAAIGTRKAVETRSVHRYNLGEAA